MLDFSLFQQTLASDFCLFFWKLILAIGYLVFIRVEANIEEIPQRAMQRMLHFIFYLGCISKLTAGRAGITNSFSSKSSSSANILKNNQIKQEHNIYYSNNFLNIQMNHRFQNAKFQDLQVLETLAETHNGSTKIYVARYQGELLVCKSIQKKSLINDAKAIEHVKNEKDALIHFTQNKSGYVCDFKGAFQDSQNLYIMMELVHGLPFHKLIQMMGPFNKKAAIIISAQVGEIMRRFHEQGYIYRDIKCSNFMIDSKGKVKMIDLGKAKLIKKERAYTICGTTHAMPPDIYSKQGYSYEFDYYSFGVLLYEMLVGSSPFGYGGSNKKILEDIQNGLSTEALKKIPCPKAVDLIKKLIVKDPKLRLGYEGGFSQILKHQYFANELSFAISILNGEEQMSPYQAQFSQLISEIQDLGIEPEKYDQINEGDPFFKFLQARQ